MGLQIKIILTYKQKYCVPLLKCTNKPFVEQNCTQCACVDSMFEKHTDNSGKESVSINSDQS